MKRRRNEKENPEQRQVFLHDDHRRPSTRREFLASGLIGASGYMVLPSVLALLTRSNEAFAASAECEAASAVRMPAFVNINLAGGAALGSNYVPLDRSGSPLANYDLLGLGRGQPPLVQEFGGVYFAGAPNGSTRLASQFLAGIRLAASQTTLDKTSFVAICTSSQDDTSNNRIDVTGLVSAAGLVGSLLPKLGTRNSTTGVQQTYALTRPPAPLVVRGIGDLTGALTTSGTLSSRLPSSKRRSLLGLVSGLSGTQAKSVALANSATGTTLAKLVQCATGKNFDLAAASSLGVDPRTDTSVDISGLWQMTTNGTLFGRDQNERLVMGSMVYNALNGNAASIGLDIGGYDYHGNNRQAVTDVRDAEAGQLIGKVLESAALMNQKVFIHVTTDGAVGAASGSDINTSFTGDRGTGSVSFLLAFNPAGRPAMKNDRPASWQLGHFKAGQAAEDQTLVGTVEKSAAASFANYLAFSGQAAAFQKYAPGHFSTQELDEILRFA